MEMQIWKFSILKKKIYKYKEKVNKLETINVSLLSFIMKHTKNCQFLIRMIMKSLIKTELIWRKKFSICCASRQSQVPHLFWYNIQPDLFHLSFISWVYSCWRKKKKKLGTDPRLYSSSPNGLARNSNRKTFFLILAAQMEEKISPSHLLSVGKIL